MTIYPVITSRKIEDQLLKLHYEIEELEDELRSAQASERGLEIGQPNHVANLQSNLQQKKFEKFELKLSISSGLAAALALANGRARAHTICAERLINLAHECEDLFEARGIRVKNRPGGIVHFRPGGKRSPHSQIGRSITTYVVMRRVSDGWRLVHAERDFCYVNQREFREFTVQPAAHKDIIRHATRGFRG
ncbi:MAG: hypothetical protein ABJN05_02540 [Sulfitobacter dubius]|uniref:hypothetical protein n=1 Tax=Parasphingorhabdus sp. TaxID=2709688 RepID=UPI003299B6D6